MADPDAPRRRPGPVRDYVAIVLAVGIATAVNLITLGVLWDAIVNPGVAGLSENATQILTAVFGGITGILGSYVGYKAHASGESSSAPPTTSTRGTTDDRPAPGPPPGPGTPGPRDRP